MLLRANASDSSLDVFRTRRRTRPRATGGDRSRVERALRLIQRW
jgi:hypothetical protein